MKTVQTKELYGAKVGDTIKYRDPLHSGLRHLFFNGPDDGHVLKVGLILDVNTRKNAARPVLCLMNARAEWLTRKHIRELADVEIVK